MFKTVDTSDMPIGDISRKLDQTKSAVFLGKNAAFLGSLLCSLEFVWSRDVSTAATDSVHLWWNPDFFMALEPKTRETVLMHELWHAARLHSVRRMSRDPKVWNQACDIRINNDLENQTGNEAMSFKGVEECWKDHSFDANGIMAEEDIYDLIQQNPQMGNDAGNGSFGQGDADADMIEIKPELAQRAVNNVVQAVQQAKLAGQAGNIPGGIETMLKKFLEPIVPWERELMQFFTDLLNEDYTWKRPNRRYHDMYLPSRFTDDGRLEHLMYFLDVSGSISDAEIIRFNSEVKYIQEVLKPQRLTLVQFDTKIQAVKEFVEEDPFDEIKIVGRGGTCLRPVREYIQEHKPTATVIFSDLMVAPMLPLDEEIPIVWVAVNAPGATVPFGKLIHIKA